MPKVRKVLLHQNGPALWPEHRTAASTIADKDVTPPHIWDTTFQLDAKSPGGSAFKREWWEKGQNRYIWHPRYFEERSIRRWISFDTAFETGETAAWTAGVCVEILDTYDMVVRDVARRHVGMDELPDFIRDFSEPYRHDGKLAGVIIEAKASGKSAIQVIEASSDRWLARLIRGWNPLDSKEERYVLAARWAKLGFLKLPFPSPDCPWLYAYTSELFDAPNSKFLDWTDATAQVMLFLQRSVFEVALAAREAANRIPR